MVLFIIFLAALTLVFGFHFYQMKQLFQVYSNLENDISEKIYLEEIKSNQIQSYTFYLDKINQKLDIIKKQIAILEILSNQ